ncbi:hypothetical protein NEAUS05_1450 [Nematocida ausubeli]|nr:hypothetical protein NEAUS05_1450 [Nematocida ausubeli]
MSKTLAAPRDVDVVISIFNTLSRPFACLCKGVAHLRSVRASIQPLHEKIDAAVLQSFEGSREHKKTKVFVLGHLAKEMRAYFLGLPAGRTRKGEKQYRFIHEVLRNKAHALIGDLNGDFFENLMNNVFGVEKKTTGNNTDVQIGRKSAQSITHWPMRLFRNTGDISTSIQDMEYYDILKEFHYAVYQSKNSILTGQNTDVWALIRELYTRTIGRTGTTPSSIDEVLFVLLIDKACRDYSPPLLIGGGVVGSLRIRRKIYFENAVRMVCTDLRNYPIRKILKSGKIYMYAPLIQGVMNVLTELGTCKKDLSAFHELLDMEIQETSSLPEMEREKAEEILKETCRISEEIRTESALPKSEERDRNIASLEAQMITQIILGSEAVKGHRCTQQQEAQIDKLVEECTATWEKIIPAIESTSTPAPSALYFAAPRDTVHKDGLTAECTYTSSIYHEELHLSTFHGARAASRIAPHNARSNSTCRNPPSINEGAEEEKVNKIDISNSKDSANPASKIASVEITADTPLKSSPSLIRAGGSEPSGKKKELGGSPASSATLTVSVGQVPKESPCSDSRCHVHTVEKEDMHLQRLSAPLDIQEESQKRQQRMEELRQYFGGLKYASFYTRNVPDHLKNLFKNTPHIYNKVKKLYDREFTDVLAKEEIRVCRRSMFRDAYSEMMNARESSEILMHVKDDVIVTKYMDTLKEQTIEKLIATEKAKKREAILQSRQVPKLKGIKKLLRKISKTFEEFFYAPVPLLSVEEELSEWEDARRKEMQDEVVFTKNSSQRVSHGFLNVSKALVDLMQYTPGYVYRKQPETVDVKEKYAAWIDREEPIDYEAVKSNPDELRALSMVFNRYIRNYNGGIISKYLYVAVAERANKVPAEKIDYGLGLLMLPTMGSNILWLLKHVVYTIEQAAKHSEKNAVSYQGIVNIVAPNLLADDVPYTMETFVIALEIAHSLFAAVRNISFLEQFFA